MAETLFDTASASVLPAVVAKESLREANGRLYAGQIFANNVAGPLLGGMLCASVAALPFPRAATFAAAALTLALRERFRARPAAREENMSSHHHQSRDRRGLSWFWRHRLPRALVPTVGVMNLTFGAAFAEWVPCAQEGPSARCATVRWPPSPLGAFSAASPPSLWRERWVPAPPSAPACRSRPPCTSTTGRPFRRPPPDPPPPVCGARDAAPLASPHARGKGAGSGGFPRAGSG